MNFHELDSGRRMAIRQAFEDMGAAVEGYHGRFIQVAAPRIDGSTSRGIEAMVAIAKVTALTVQDNWHFFPLGSDNPAQHLRHDGRYPGSRGFWLYGSFGLPHDPFRMPAGLPAGAWELDLSCLLPG